MRSDNQKNFLRAKMFVSPKKLLHKQPISVTFNNQTYNFTYKRNYYGFRGDEIKLKDIKALMIGGSTADERYKPEELTIVGLLNQKFLF